MARNVRDTIGTVIILCKSIAGKYVDHGAVYLKALRHGRETF
jgi:hypothetical protein